MHGRDIITLGLGLQGSWEIVSQELVTETTPHELRLAIRARRGDHSFPARCVVRPARPTTTRR